MAKYWGLESLRILFIIILLAALNGCSLHDKNPKEFIKLFESELRPGDSQDKIISFLNSHDMAYGFDDLQLRYQVANPARDTSAGYPSFVSYQIYIYVDESHRFLRAEVEKACRLL